MKRKSVGALGQRPTSSPNDGYERMNVNEVPDVHQTDKLSADELLYLLRN